MDDDDVLGNLTPDEFEFFEEISKELLGEDKHDDLFGEPKPDNRHTIIGTHGDS